MNDRRTFLKSALLAGVLPLVKVKGESVAEPELESFEPDIALEPGNPLCWHITGMFLDGKKCDLNECFSALVNWRSFDKPTAGEITVAVRNEKGDMMATWARELGPDECAWDMAIAKRVSGKVYIELDETGRHVLEQMRER